MQSAWDDWEHREPPKSEERAFLSAPETLGPYRVGTRLGAGGVGVVHRAIDARTGAPVAIKIARHDRADYRETIAREVELLSRFRDPGIVQLRDHSIDADMPWYAMELLDGASLRDVMEGAWMQGDPVQSGPRRSAHRARERHGAVQPGFMGEALRVVREVCGPLAYLHREGFVHADVKPENVFLCEGGRVVLLDFGAAQPIEEPGLTGPCDWVTFGTWTYMAPECRVGACYDHRADVYAVGCMLYELVVGCTPTEHAMLRKTPEPEQATALDAVPQPLSDLIRRLVAREARLRPRDLAECATELDLVAKLFEPILCPKIG